MNELEAFARAKDNGDGMNDWVVWVESEEGYLLDPEWPNVVTSFASHAEHYSETDARAIAERVGGEAVKV